MTHVSLLLIKNDLMEFQNGGDGVLRYQIRLFVPAIDNLRERIFEEAPSS